jgi:hypothetical protein
MSPQQFKDLIRIASEISEKSADAQGYVPVHRLAESFQAEIEFRPLLVEGVIARPKDTGGRWKVFIDSETHARTTESLAGETSANPLPSRLRNTLAHELAHTLAFRSEEFKIEIKGSREEFVEQLERETENLSPVLLLPYSEIQKLCAENLRIENLVAFRKAHAVSNEVLVQRFEMLRRLENHALQFAPALTNIAIGTGEWKNSDTPVLSSWPVFSKFSGLIPFLLTQLKNKQGPSLADSFKDADFVANAGTAYSSRASIDAGTSQNPSGDHMPVEIQIEETVKTAGTKFLWVLKTAN